MILGIGVDTVSVARFVNWHHKSEDELLRIFHPDEIAYCSESPVHHAERFAARFAAREALFKAIMHAIPKAKLPLLTLCRNTKVVRDARGIPALQVAWDKLPITLPCPAKKIRVHFSLTHSESDAIAWVILERQDS